MSTIISDMVSHLQCGVAIAANEAVYINSADGKIYKYDPLQPLQVYAGIAKEAGLLNAFIRVVQSGRVKGFSGLTPGAFVYASVTVPGGFQLTDPGSSLKVVLGIAKSATELTVNGALGIKTGGGTGSGGINYILNPDADTTVGWATYADAGGVTPIDGTGGSPTVTLTRSTSSPLRGTASFLYTKPTSNVQGQGFSYDFTIDSADTGKVLQGSFDYQIASGTFADDAMTVWIYDITNARMIQPAPYLLKNSGLIERFPIEFQTAINSTSYRLIVHQASTSAVACTIKLDSFFVGPSAKLYGSAVTDFVPTAIGPVTGLGGGILNIGTGGGATYSVVSKRIGDEILARYTLRIGTSGATDVTGGWLFPFPTGFAYSGTSNYETLGYGDITSTATAAPVARLTAKYYLGGIIVDISDSSILNSGGLAFNNANILNMTIRYKVSGWSSSQIMSSDADTRVVAAQYRTSTVTQTLTDNTATKRFLGVANFDTHGATTGSHEFRVPVSGYYEVEILDYIQPYTYVAGNEWSIFVYKNGAYDKFAGDKVFANASSSGQFEIISGKVTLQANAGDLLSIYMRVNRGGPSDLSYDAAFGTTTFKKLSGPAQIAASESVSALYTGAPPTGTLNNSVNTVTFGTKVKDSHNAYSGGTYTVPVSGTYSISACTYQAATYALGSTSVTYIVIDGIAKYASSQFAAGNVGIIQTLVTAQSIPLLAGQVVTISASNSATSPSYQNQPLANYFSITRTGQY